MTHIRLATLADAPALAQMFTHFNAGYDDRTITPEQIAARLRDTEGIETTLIGELDGVPVGFGCVRLVAQMSGDEPYAELSDLFVEPEARRRGVGRALLAALDQRAWAGGAASMQIITGFDNAAAQALYRALGYTDWALAMKKKAV